MNFQVVDVPSAPSSDAQSRKLGLWFGPRLKAAAWNLRPGQQIVPHMHPDADGMVVVLSGSGDFLVYEEDAPNPDMCYVPSPINVVAVPSSGAVGEPGRRPVGPGSIGFAPAGVFYGLANTGAEPLVAVTVTSSDTDSTVWAARAY